jgi:hypothetical protein
MDTACHHDRAWCPPSGVGAGSHACPPSIHDSPTIGAPVHGHDNAPPPPVGRTRRSAPTSGLRLVLLMTTAMFTSSVRAGLRPAPTFGLGTGAFVNHQASSPPYWRRDRNGLRQRTRITSTPSPRRCALIAGTPSSFPFGQIGEWCPHVSGRGFPCPGTLPRARRWGVG